MVGPENIEEIAQAILHLLNGKKYTEELCRNGRRRVVVELNSGIVGKKHESILARAIAVP